METVHGIDLRYRYSERIKAWPELARERSLEVRRRNARLKETKRRSRYLSKLTVERHGASKTTETPMEQAERYAQQIPAGHFRAVQKAGTLKGIRFMDTESLKADYVVSGGQSWVVPYGFFALGSGFMRVDITETAEQGRDREGGVQHVFYHEFAHALYHSISSEATLNQNPTAKGIRAELLSGWNKGEWRYITVHSSATQDFEETFADAYSQYLMGGKRRESLFENAPTYYKVMKLLCQSSTNWWSKPRPVAKSWPDLARERSLETRRRNAKRKKEEKRPSYRFTTNAHVDPEGPYVGLSGDDVYGNPDKLNSRVDELFSPIPKNHLNALEETWLLNHITVCDEGGIKRAYLAANGSLGRKTPFGFYREEKGRLWIDISERTQFVKEEGLDQFGGTQQVFNHEVAHAIWATIDRGLVRRNPEASRLYSELGKAYYTSKTEDGIEYYEFDFMSAYARQSGHAGRDEEVFAEAYSLYLMGGSFRKSLKTNAPTYYSIVERMVESEIDWWSKPKTKSKAWTDLSRERSLEVRRRNARLKENHGRSKAIRKLIDESEFAETVVNETIEAAEKHLSSVPLSHFRATQAMGALSSIVALSSHFAMASAYFGETGKPVNALTAPSGFYIPMGGIFVNVGGEGRLGNKHTFLHEFGHAIFQTLSMAPTGTAINLYAEAMMAHEAEWGVVSPYTNLKKLPTETFADAYAFFLTGRDERELLFKRAPRIYTLIAKLMSSDTNWWSYPRSKKKAWPNLARERSLEVRRRNARLKETTRKSRQFEKMVVEQRFNLGGEPATLKGLTPQERLEVWGRPIPAGHLTAVRKHKTLRKIVFADEANIRLLYPNRSPLGFYHEYGDEGWGLMVVDVTSRTETFYERVGGAQKVFLHEFGHAVWNTFMKSGTRLADELYGQFSDAHADEWDLVSTYARRKDDVRETFAEAYTYYLISSETRERLMHRAPKTYAAIKRICQTNSRWWSYPR